MYIHCTLQSSTLHEFLLSASLPRVSWLLLVADVAGWPVLKVGVSSKRQDVVAGLAGAVSHLKKCALQLG